MNMVAMKRALVLEVQNLVVSPMAAAVLTCQEIDQAVNKHEHGDFVRDRNQRFKSFFESKMDIPFHVVTDADGSKTSLWIDMVGKDVYLSESAWTDDNVEMPIGTKCSILTYNVERQELFVTATKNDRVYSFYVHEYWITPYQSRTVSIPASHEHGGNTWNLVSVTIPWVCSKCGGPRGEVFEGFSYDGPRRLKVDCWKNPCGHIDPYEDIRQEAGVFKTNKENVIFPLPVAFGAYERCEKVIFERVNLHKWKQVDTSALFPPVKEKDVSVGVIAESPRRRLSYTRLIHWLNSQSKTSLSNQRQPKRGRMGGVNPQHLELVDIKEEIDVSEPADGVRTDHHELTGTRTFPFHDLVIVRMDNEREFLKNPQQVEVGAMLFACAATLTDRHIFKRNR